MTKQELEERISELETENEDLHSRLDSVMEIAAPGEPDGEQDEEDGDDHDADETEDSDELEDSDDGDEDD